MMLTACSTPDYNFSVHAYLKSAEQQLSFAHSLNTGKKQGLANPYLERASKFMQSASKAQTRNNTKLANQYFRLAISETEVAIAALSADEK